MVKKHKPKQKNSYYFYLPLVATVAREIIRAVVDRWWPR